MKKKIGILFIAMICMICSVNAQNGKIVDREEMNLYQNSELADRISDVKNGERVLKKNTTIYKMSRSKI